MSSLREQIIQSQKEAMKERNQSLLETLRNLWSGIKNEEIEKQHPLNDDEIQAVAKRQVKQLQDALIDFQKGNREDLVEKSQQEIKILSVYLPQLMSSEELEKVINGVLEENKDKELNMGVLMGLVMQKVKGKADGGMVREIVTKKLNKI